MFSELHARGGEKYDKYRTLPVLYPVGYLKTTIITETNKVLNYPSHLGEFMRCMGCWIYMDCWVEISNRRDWWPVTPPVMHRGAHFWLNQYMSHHHFDGMISSLRYTNREVHCEDIFLHMRQMKEA